MKDLRKLARGQDCLVRLPGCNGGGETTVLAHYRMAGYCGTGIKPPDILGAWCCSRCHDICDGREQNVVTPQEARLAHSEGVLRTVAALVKIGAIK